MPRSKKIIADSIHGVIHLTDLEREIIDTATFQRLRYIKQLSMGHLTYPNATHTRFAHSLGVLHIMSKVTDLARETLGLEEEQIENLRLAALLHDIGHYPYSHLMEKIDKVLLMEDLVESKERKRKLDASHRNYPGHEALGETIIKNQPDILKVLKSDEKAQRIADLFQRKMVADQQLSKLINSSFDMDRLDYLQRDSKAAGVPYGAVDMNYLLNSLRMSPSGMLGVEEKALPAAEQFLMARYFMYRTVYYHRTTVGMEEACRQLLRRIRNRRHESSDSPNVYNFPVDGDEVDDIVKSKKRLRAFDDSFVDEIIRRAADDSEDVVRALADAILTRRPPKLLHEIPVVHSSSGDPTTRGLMLREKCKDRVATLAGEFSLPIGMFMFHETPPIRLEQRGAQMNAQEARDLPEEEADELIKVFIAGGEEPLSLVDVENSMVARLAGHVFQYFRLYLVRSDCISTQDLDRIREEVMSWMPS